LEEPYPSGWSYQLSPYLVLRTRLHPGGVPPTEQILLVRSGEAFPPGHPTTRLCLDLLREAVAAGSVHRVLDVGCGAGVLSLAAAALGVPRVVGIDISHRAALATWENTRENSLAGSIIVAQGSLTKKVMEPYDILSSELHLHSYFQNLGRRDI
jgi:ribosomal protein L11 methyltransferase